MLVDTHSHLYSKHFNKDIDDVIKRSIDNGITKIYMPNIDNSTTKSMLNLEKKAPDLFASMMGIHPCEIKQNYKKELDIAHKELLRGNYVGVGEIGIDLYWDKTFKNEQIDAFKTQVNWAKELDLPVIIHCRESMDLTIDIIKQEKTDKLKGIFHCFTGSVDQAFEIMKLGFYMGIGGILTYKNSGLKEVVNQIPMEYLVLETDSPYLPPVPYRGKRNESSYVRYVAEELANVKKLTFKEVARQTSMNADRIFKKG
ncbi:MAG: hydrolase TatD [Bacteroidia bacterium]|nr:MAG: hydrolase TatD [Bacteroidia bacterium]